MVLLAREGSPLAKRAAQAGIETVELGYASRFSPASDLRDARRLARLVRAAPGGAVVHCHRGKDHWSAEAARLVFGLRCPLVRSRHVVTPVGGHFANRWLFRRAARVICVSRATRAGYESSGRLPAGGLEVIPSGSCDLERFRPADAQRRAEARRRLGIEPGARVAVLVGRMPRVKRVKGHHVLLAAAGPVAERVPESVFLLVGDGNGRADLERQASELGLSERVRILGHRDDVPEILAACDLGVVASLESEGFSRAALEYMGAGLPVVATRVGALPEIVVPDATGRLVEPSSAGALAEAVTDLLGNPERCAEMGRAGRERAESVFSRERWLDAHERVYRDVMSEACPPAAGVKREA